MNRSYADLSIHEKISLKGIFRAFLNISVERFHDSLATKNVVDSGSLYRSISTFLSGSDSELKAKISFNLYGRFVDMGAGRGSYKGQRKKSKGKYYQRNEDGKRGNVLQRQPTMWYSKVKYREVARLREILVNDYGIYLMHLGEELNQNVNITH